MQRLKHLQNGQLGSKIQNAKDMRKMILQKHYSCSVQKTATKNTKYSLEEKKKIVLKIGHLAKAIALAKWSVCVKNVCVRKTILQER